MRGKGEREERKGRKGGEEGEKGSRGRREGEERKGRKGGEEGEKGRRGRGKREESKGRKGGEEGEKGRKGRGEREAGRKHVSAGRCTTSACIACAPEKDFVHFGPNPRTQVERLDRMSHCFRKPKVSSVQWAGRRLQLDKSLFNPAEMETAA